MNLYEILNGNRNLNSLSQKEYLSIIEQLINAYKYQLSKASNTGYLEEKIRVLNAEVIQLTTELTKSKEMNVNINKIFNKKLSLKERILGKIDLKIRTQK